LKKTAKAAAAETRFIGPVTTPLDYAN
jgi:hypothetical protein